MTTSLRWIETLERRIAIGHTWLTRLEAALTNILANENGVQEKAAPASHFDGRAMNQAQYVAYCRELRKANALLPVTMVVVHHSVTGEYPSLSIEQVLSNWWVYFTKTKNWVGAPHGVIFTRGIGLLNGMGFDGVHVSGYNTNTRGAEILGNFTSVLPSGALLDNAVCWFAGCLYAGKMGIDALKMHRSLNATACPGNKLAANWAWFQGLVADKLKWFYDTETPIPPDPPDPPLPTEIAVLQAKVAAHGRLIVELEQANRDRIADIAAINRDLASQGLTLADHDKRIAELEQAQRDLVAADEGLSADLVARDEAMDTFEERVTTMETVLAQAAAQYEDLAGRVKALEEMNGDGK